MNMTFMVKIFFNMIGKVCLKVAFAEIKYTEEIAVGGVAKIAKIKSVTV
jgi:hypothetical protein